MSDPGRSARSYAYHDARASHTSAYLWPAVRRELETACREGAPRRVFELGCGNGALARSLSADGFEVTGVDPSSDGIRHARREDPTARLFEGSSDDDLATRFGQFPLLVSLEVVEHVYAPRRFMAAVHDLLAPGGRAIISTPYHGYWKNLAMAVTGRMDDHFTALWDNGHIKFWSRRTLGALAEEAGLTVVRWHRVGRVPALAKSMILVAQRPASEPHAAR